MTTRHHMERKIFINHPIPLIRGNVNVPTQIPITTIGHYEVATEELGFLIVGCLQVGVYQSGVVYGSQSLEPFPNLKNLTFTYSGGKDAKVSCYTVGFGQMGPSLLANDTNRFG